MGAHRQTESHNQLANVLYPLGMPACSLQIDAFVSFLDQGVALSVPVEKNRSLRAPSRLTQFVAGEEALPRVSAAPSSEAADRGQRSLDFWPPSLLAWWDSEKHLAGVCAPGENWGRTFCHRIWRLSRDLPQEDGWCWCLGGSVVRRTPPLS